ncbi:F-box/LRR-repeat protein 15-like [Strongylocentrotus purpuratus]|uniref:F-box/LRR-repeat protein 15-like leucin rich repeat domain-containing protein n=1 Tax=Strongylocentrotus purpuratus TaxID=7668 RepID=A0A7M7NFD2_STRPU|nr:F-box/LRR-repeat protein 15-like [Strongylocentrotus purpuratus]XP_030835613.1 F-box/LRR-repeat protein 15-like [Strongylocentrotus purpuratus]|eukprot:XP_003730881.1 PREDICTED: F-box/LRR-repeat protein 15 [Strongylocentrotus purpuratus]
MAGDGQEWEEVIILQNQDGEPIAKKRMDVNGEQGRKSESDVNGSRDAGSGALDRDVLSHLSIMSMKAGLSFSPQSDWTKVCKERTSQRSRDDDEEEDEEEEDDNPLNVVPADGLTVLDILPWEDVLVSRILPFMSLTDLFQLRQVSCGCRDAVAIFFASNHHLDLSAVGPEFTQDAFRVVSAEAKNLTTLNVANCKKWITDDLILPVIEANRNLRDISISENSSLSTNVVRRIATRCPDLCSLSLAECQQVTSTSVECVGMNCDQLEHLDLRGCWAMDDDTLSLVLQLHPQLKWLSVARAYGVTDLLVDQICTYCPNIEYLDVEGCWRITDAAIRQLWNLESLKTLKVKDCRYITERSLARFRAKGVQIDVLLPEESDLAKLERHLRAREFGRARSIPPNFAL